MKILNKVNIPENKKVFFVGDIHGRYDELLNKLNSLILIWNTTYSYLLEI